MTEQEHEDCVDELYAQMFEVCRRKPAADVIYALGMIIAYAIIHQATSKNPEETFTLLRKVVDIELSLMKERT